MAMPGLGGPPFSISMLLLLPHRALAVYILRSSEEECHEADVNISFFCVLGRALAKTRALSLTKTSELMSKVSGDECVEEFPSSEIGALEVFEVVFVVLVSVVLLLRSKSKTLLAERSAGGSACTLKEDSLTKFCMNRCMGSVSREASIMFTVIPIWRVQSDATYSEVKGMQWTCSSGCCCCFYSFLVDSVSFSIQWNSRLAFLTELSKYSLSEKRSPSKK